MSKKSIIEQLLDLKNITKSDDKEKNKQIDDKIKELISDIERLKNGAPTDSEPKRFPDVSYFKSNKKSDPWHITNNRL